MSSPKKLERLLSFFKGLVQSRKDEVVIMLLSLAGICIHLIFYQNLGFHRDELLYFSFADHLDFGYFSVPPMIGLMAFVSTKIFGYTLFAAKIIPALTGGFMVWLVASMARELKGGLFAQVLAATGLICSIIFLRCFSLFQPVFSDLFFWTLMLYVLLRYVRNEQKRQLYFLGFVIGLGILNKYNLLFLVIAVVCILPITKYKRLFGQKEFYIAILIAILVALPNIVWQILHHMPVFSHLVELRNSQLVQMRPVTFLAEQLLMIYPAILVALPGFLFLLFGKKVLEYRWIGYSLLAVLGIYLVLHGKSYYAAGIYPLLIAAGAVWYENALKNSFLRTLMIGILVFLTWTVLPMGLPSKSPEKLVAYFDKTAKITGSDAVRRYENNKYYALPQDYADMLGWDELADVTYKAWCLTEHKDQCLIYAENYGQAGAVNIVGKHYHMPAAVSFSDNFRYWLPGIPEKEILEFIYINNELGKDIQQLFADIQEVGRITNPLAREYGTRVYLCRSPRISFNQFLRERIPLIH
jgi:hypothetical protein